MEKLLSVFFLGATSPSREPLGVNHSLSQLFRLQMQWSVALVAVVLTVGSWTGSCGMSQTARLPSLCGNLACHVVLTEPNCSQDGVSLTQSAPRLLPVAARTHLALASQNSICHPQIYGVSSCFLRTREIRSRLKNGCFPMS